MSILLAALFNQMLKLFIVPTCFKSARIIPLFKGKGLRMEAKNYRPNSILKVFEKFLCNTVTKRVDALLVDNQHAYRRKRSGHSPLTIFAKYIYLSIDRPKSKVGAIFFYIKGALIL